MPSWAMGSDTLMAQELVNGAVIVFYWWRGGGWTRDIFVSVGM